MNYRINILVIAAAATLAAVLPTHASGIIPAPAQCELLAGQFKLDAGTVICRSEGAAAEAAGFLHSGLKTRGLELPVVRPNEKSAPGIRLELAPTDEKSAEGYSLEVSSDAVTLRAASGVGLFYAVQSLLQLADAQGVTGGTAMLPALRITDAPRYEWRGLMLDESRHFFGKKTVEEFLDMMAYLKMNRFHWHLTDDAGWRMEIKKYPLLTQVGGQGNGADPQVSAQYYTQTEIREIVEYARQRHIVVIPEIDMPGHATAAARAYPEISGGGTGKWDGFTFNPAREGTYIFLENVLKEAAALFPAPYIHIGGDEVHYGNQPWSTDPEIVKFTRDQHLANPLELERYFVRRMAGVVNGLGKTTAGWDEIAGAGVNASKSVVMWWRHDKPEILRDALEKDFSVVLCPRLPCYFDFVQDKSHQYGRRWDGNFVTLEDICLFPTSEIAALVPAGKEANILGIQACLWTEQIQNRERLEFMAFPRLAALAEAAWTPAGGRNSSGFRARLPGFFRELDRRHIPYFNPFDPEKTPEPPGPVKKTGQTGDG